MADFISTPEKKTDTEGEQIIASKKTREIARRMIIDGIPLEKVSRMTELSMEVIQELTAEVAAKWSCFSRWSLQDFLQYKRELLEKENYAIEFASERAEGKAEGIEEGEQIGLEKGEKIGLKKGREETTREFARKMIIDGMPLEKVARMTKLSMEIVQELATEVAAGLREDA